jgi:signal transduction histidine kinase
VFPTVSAFLHTGKQLPEDQRPLVFVAGVLSLVFAGLSFLLALILYMMFGWLTTQGMVIGAGVAFLLVPVVNGFGFSNLGRLMFCIIPVVFAMVITLYGKIQDPRQSYIVYFDSRYILLVTTVLPAIVFSFRERLMIASCLLLTLGSLIFFDPIHNFFGIGYYQSGHTVQSYYYINYITFISFFALSSAIFVLKWRDFEASEKLKQLLVEKLDANTRLVEQNKRLEHITQEMEAQNEEMQQQQEELHTGHEMLERANRVIGEQRTKLEAYNKELESLVKEKSADLVKTNEELVKSNNELRQFSFTVSHNLRGPVARLLGLTNLLKYSKTVEDTQNLSRFIHQSASELDGILKDLAQIIDIRNELYRVREKIALKEEWSKTEMLTGLNTDRTTVTTSFEQSPYLFAIRPMVQSILYNLLSNSIKYKSPDREHRIEVQSYSDAPGRVVLEIRDNGLGMDLKAHRENLFRLYKRFHHHVPGKGMGLYLIKTQMEIMNGKVEVESEPDKGALFRLIFPIPDDVDKQVFYENDSAQLYYDANINNTVIIWKRNLQATEYRKAFEVVLQTIKTYNTPGWIADLRNQGKISPEDQQWFITHVLQAAAHNGLVRIGTVGFTDPIRTDYFERMKAITSTLGIELRTFDTVEAAVEWMRRFSRQPR